MEKQNKLSVQHLMGIKKLTPQDVDLIFDTATQFKEVINRPIKKVPSLRDITIANIFFENSTRTKLSFELAQKRLSADIVNFSAAQSSVKKGETLIDTVNNILSMKVDMVVMRHSSPGAHHFLSQHTDSVIVNAGDGTHEHPTQALLDAFSMREKIGDLTNKQILIVGDIRHSRVALSDILLLQLLGAKVGLCGPYSLMPKGMEDLGVLYFENFDEGLAWADVVNMLRIQKERLKDSYFPSEREYQAYYGLTAKRYAHHKHQPIIMHPGPINRGIELSSEMADSKHSIILDQVENGVAIRMAVMYLLIQRKQLKQS